MIALNTQIVASLSNDPMNFAAPPLVPELQFSSINKSHKNCCSFVDDFVTALDKASARLTIAMIFLGCLDIKFERYLPRTITTELLAFLREGGFESEANSLTLRYS